MKLILICTEEMLILMLMLLLNKALPMFFSFPIAFLMTFFFFRLGVSKNCTSPAIFSFSISKLIRCSEPPKGLLTHIAYLASLLSLFLRNCGKESDTMGAYQKKPAISSSSLGTFSVLTNSIHAHNHSAAVYGL